MEKIWFWLLVYVIVSASVGFAQDDYPVAYDDFAATMEGELVTIDVLSNDMNADVCVGDFSHWSEFGYYKYTDHGKVYTHNISLIYSPDAGFCGEDSFTYMAGKYADDHIDLSNEATVYVTVECPCTATAPDICVCEGSTNAQIESLLKDSLVDCGDCTITAPYINGTYWPSALAGVMVIPAGDYVYNLACIPDNYDDYCKGDSYDSGWVFVRPNNICEFSDNQIQGELYIGNKLTDGTVTAMIVDDQLEVTFDLSSTDYDLTETQVWAGTTPPPCNPGKSRGFEGESLDGEKIWTMYVQLPTDLGCGDNLYIGAHLSTTNGETGWASFGDCTPNCKAKNWAYCMVKTVECVCTCDCETDWMPGI